MNDVLSIKNVKYRISAECEASSVESAYEARILRALPQAPLLFLKEKQQKNTQYTCSKQEYKAMLRAEQDFI